MVSLCNNRSLFIILFSLFLYCVTDSQHIGNHTDSEEVANIMKSIGSILFIYNSVLIILCENYIIL